MTLAKKILGIGSGIILGGAMIYHVASELNYDLKFRKVGTIEYRENIGSLGDTFRLEFPMMHDTDHDGTPDVTQVKKGIVPGVLGAMPVIYTSEIRKPTEKEIQYFQSEK